MAVLKDTPKVKVNGQSHEMERLTLNSVFKFLAIIKKIGINKAVHLFTKYLEYERAEINCAAEETDTKEMTEQKELVKSKVQMEMFASVANIIENISEAEAEISTFGAVLLGVTKEEFATLSLDEVLDILIALKDHPDIQAFTKSLQKVLGAEIKATPTATATISATV